MVIMKRRIGRNLLLFVINSTVSMKVPTFCLLSETPVILSLNCYQKVNNFMDTMDSITRVKGGCKRLNFRDFLVYFCRKADLPSFEYPADSPIDRCKNIQVSTMLDNVGQVTREICDEYCSGGTIHGTKYLGEAKRHWLEKLWWITFFAISCLLCGSLILKTYDKWVKSPVIVSFAERSTSVGDIPFPSVTICPETKSHKKMLNFTEVYHKMVAGVRPPYNISDREREYMEAVSQVCEAHLTDQFEIGDNFTDSKIIDLLREVAPKLKDTMQYCKFRNAFEYCSEYFDEIITDEGLCFTFNTLNSKELYTDEISKDFLLIENNITSNWSLETGYQELSSQAYPYRVFGSGARVGLFILLQLYKQNLEYICRGPVQGFKISLHTPGEIPQVSKHYFRVPLLQEVLVTVKPDMMTTSEGLLGYEPNRRQCYFNSERQLRFYKAYSQRNCEIECLSNFTLKACGCVKFSMPRDDQTPICGASKIACYNQAEDDLSKKEFRDEHKMTEKDETIPPCDCLPGCTSITYNAEITQAPFDFVSLYKAYGRTLGDSGMQPARVAIFFKENQFITSKRSELYGPTDFLANCGGLLGLFMGVSLLSFVEIIYYFSLRLCCNLKRKAKQTTSNEISMKSLILPIEDGQARVESP